MHKIAQVQLGKQGITENFITTLKNHFKNHEQVRVSVLRNTRKDKSQVKEFSEQILKKLGKNYTARIIGFTIVIRKWRRAIR